MSLTISGDIVMTRSEIPYGRRTGFRLDDDIAFIQLARNAIATFIDFTMRIRQVLT